ncbi:uncharacterized protein Dmoj_GI21130 [Drosophila mojavensis]|uniref:Spermatogenesis-associated protein 17 n=1 Tax=Drosophila mojavensis TaxID=7230 RepID=B4KS66_DROMO|nr:uncharacterized protein Dmoj_GI21130 [Drosophila mojavensis]
MFQDGPNISNLRLTHQLDVTPDDSCSERSTNEFTRAVLARTPLLLVDYVQFLAARKIQKHWRGYYARSLLYKRWLAAVTIQRWWRGYWVRKSHFGFVENKLQTMLVDHYDRAATKIQALYRGWRIRQTVHDSKGLSRLQNCAAEDLLNCVASKLHYMLRTYQIPGVYSLRNSHCLSRVEKLLASTQYRFHNARVHSDMAYRKNVMDKHRKEYKQSKFYTNVPFKGPDYNLACKPHCREALHRTKDIDGRMFKIINDYEKAQMEAKAKMAKYNLAERKRRQHINMVLQRCQREKRNFCADVIASMRRWSIWNGTNFAIDKDIFRNTEKLEHFLDEAFEIMDNLVNCHCKMPVHDIVFCH